MLRLARSLWIWSASAILVLSWCPLLGIIRLFDRDPLRRTTARWFRRLGRAVAKVNPLWRLHITGAENFNPSTVYVIVSNHQSLADIPLLSHLMLDAKWLGKAELMRLPVFGWMMKWAGDVPVERGDRRKAAKALLQCGTYLRQGCSVLFFPEGTRSPDGSVLPFNDGPFQLAIRENVMVLPVVVEGSGAALPKSTWLFGDSLDIYLKVLPPVPVSGYDVKQCGDLRAQVRERIIAELESLRSHALAA